jgi:sugar lactone lactonase YvrE
VAASVFKRHPYRLAILLTGLIAVAVLSAHGGNASGPGTISTIAGGGIGDGGMATNASVGTLGLAIGGDGTAYLADGSLCRIRSVTSGTITTVAGNGECAFGGDNGLAVGANLNLPFDVAVDSLSNVYIADRSNCRIRRLSNGTITTIAGNGSCGYAGDGGPATSASINHSNGVAVDAAGNVFIADTDNCRVREVNSMDVISTVAGGTCGRGGGGDGGPATSASFSFVTGLAVDLSGNLFVADAGDCRIRQVAGGTISTFAGDGTCAYGGDGHSAVSASLNSPRHVAVDGSDLYIADTENCRIRKVTAGVITTIAGTGACADRGDGGSALLAQVGEPFGIAIHAGDLYVSDTDGCAIRKISAGTISNFAGGECGYAGDGGPGTNASMFRPGSVTIRNAALYIADTLDCRVRTLSGGTITTAAGTGVCGSTGDGGSATAAEVSPVRVTTDSAGNMYIVENCRVRRITGGIVATIAGTGVCATSGDGGSATSANLNRAMGVVVDVDGAIYIAEAAGCRVRKVVGGVISTLVGGICAYGGDGGPASQAGLVFPVSVAVDGGGALFIADATDCRVRMVRLGTITTVAGTGTCGYSGDGGPATAATLSHPQDVAVGPDGKLYIADTDNCRIRVVDGGVINTAVGNICGFSGDNGPALSADISNILGITVDGANNLYVADSENARVREVLGAPPRDHKTDANGDGYSAADEDTIANCGATNCASITTWGTAETRTCKDPGRSCGSPGTPADDTAPARVAPPPADGYGCSVTLDTVGPRKTTKLAKSDIDLDGVVSILDLSKVAGWFGDAINPSPADPRWEGDMDGDGHISILDLSAMASNFGRSVAGDCQVE